MKREKKQKQGIKPPSNADREYLKDGKNPPKVFVATSDADYPLFCFKHLSDKSLKGCKDAKFLSTFLFRLQKLSSLGWNGIRESERHGFGMEKIPINKVRPKPPAIVTPDVKELDVFRATGDNRPVIGLQDRHIFRVFFIETNFGDIYKH